MQSAVARYPRPLQYIHWVVALLVMAQLAIALVLTQLRSLAFGQVVLEVHRQMGLIILLLLLLRVAIGHKYKVPRHTVGALPIWQVSAAVWVHRSFFVLLILQPLLGIALSWGRGDPVKLMGLMAVSAPFEISDAARDHLMQAHIVNASALLGLSLLHIGAIVFNRLVRGVSVLERMLPAVSSKKLTNRTPIAAQMSLAFGLLIAIAMITGMYAISKYRDATRLSAAFQSGDMAAADTTRAAQVAWKELLGLAAAVPAAAAGQAVRELADAAKSSLDDAATHSKTGDMRGALTTLSGKIVAATPADALWKLAELRSIDAELQDIVDSQSAGVFQQRTENDDQAARGHDLIVVALFPTVIVGIFAALVLARSINGSLDRMRVLVRAVAAGQTEGAMEVIGRGEFSVLMHDMLKMRAAVEQRGNEAAAQGLAFESERARLSEEQQAREAVAERAAAVERQRRLACERQRVALEFETQVAGIVESVADTVRELKVTAEKMAASASDTVQCSRAASAVARKSSDTASAIATGAVQLSTAAKAVRGHAEQSKSQALLAVEEAAAAKSQIENLVAATRQISSIAEIIGGIAQHTNLLAINARIQAALAGDSGRGFAIVAAEVKDLAAKTRSAVAGIGGQIDQVGNAAARSVEFLLRVSARIETLEGAASGIFDSAASQCVSTSDIADRMGDVSASTQSVAKNIDAAQGTANSTEQMSAVVLQAADLLEDRAHQLQEQISRFVLRVKEGSGEEATLGGPADLAPVEPKYEPPAPLALAG